ncbi:MAG: phenylalanine--tRNA ligase subunit beta [Patescibacteria group bacterium]|nr:phenylalanine--tRNA ligase subunit beta [Patescibacteria group bacterium]
MNLLVSYDWLKEYVGLKQTPEEFGARISLSGPSVEKIFPQGVDLDGVYVGKITKISNHPQADKLKLVDVDLGSLKPPLGKGESKGESRIVCGGSNLYEGQIVAVAVSGAKVRWHGEGDLIELQPTEIRGEKSDGMICAASEIGLGEAFPVKDDHEILDLGKEIPEMNVKPGTTLAKALGLDGDVVMDIEVTSNRPDSMGMVGIAREAAAILDVPFTYKPSDLKVPFSKGGSKGGIKLKIEAKDACSRYIGTRIDGVKVGPSPWWLKRRLLSAGIRPINNLVDITNYVMYETGQPMHVFDVDKLKSSVSSDETSPLLKEINVRYARKGEKIMALDGKVYDLPDSVLVIADAEDPIAIAGVMGGEETGSTEETVNIILEAAAFDPVVVRKGSRKLLLQSDSQLRFEKGLSQIGPESAMARAIELVKELAGGEVVGAPVDVQTKKYKPESFSITTDEVNALIGVEISKKEMIDVLKRLGFKIKDSGKKLTAEVPWWRDHDIESGRDLVEEIARIYGYGKIEAVVPTAVAPRKSDDIIVWEDRIKDLLAGAGYTELYGYSFVSKDLLAKSGFDAKDLLHVQNPLTVELEVMRSSLIPQLLEAVANNQERADTLRLFECSNVYLRKAGKKGAWTDLPDENPQCVIGYIEHKNGSPWREAKGIVEYIFDTFDIKDVKWKRVSQDDIWHPGRGVQAYKDDKLLATVGEISPKYTEAFKIESRVGAVQLELRNVINFAKTHKSYTPPMPFPESKRDLAIVVGEDVEYRDIELVILKVNDLILNVEWFDTYQGKGVAEGKKSVAMHLTIGSREKTLTSQEIDGVLEEALLAAKEKFGAELR